MAPTLVNHAVGAASSHPQHKYSTTVRLADTDASFDNSILSLVDPSAKHAALNAHGVPYTPENTWLRPNGDRKDYLAKTAGLTTLQRHIAYFDGDCDGVITMTETFWGFYYLGFGLLLSLLSVLIIHGPFSYPTLPVDDRSRVRKLLSYLPDPRMRIYMANINRAMHGSDSASYTKRGEHDKSQFERIVNEYSSAAGRDALCFADAMVMIKQRRHLMDLFGISAFLFEWGSTYMLLWPSDGYMKLEDIQGVLDGSIFVVIAARRKATGKDGAFQRSYRKSVEKPE